MTPTFAWTDEMNRGRRERRQIHTQAATPEVACFPHVEQIAQLYRHIGKHKTARASYLRLSALTASLNLKT